ncbi:TPR repeat-containing thioredoxin TTL4 [Capsicum baccatum]|uniref:TPR repeat-containing thioredoxin TTL4 n=1 Tax=Capsicum baccatum TaxID=33114 RepID=A0A2G2VCK6_CAPBA|nr:TPR repeat-containing thioredoxin TTL4 [Capsicum baccatum]
MFLSLFGLQWAMIRTVRDLLEFLESWEVHQKDLVNDSCLHFMVADWWSTLREADVAIASRADASPQLHACRAEALLKLHRLEDAELSPSNARNNNLFKSERFTEACAAYGEDLRLDFSNAVLYCNREACWYKLRQWEKSVDNCNQALCIQPNYTEALLRKAASNAKLERWVEAVINYEVLRKELPYDNEVADTFSHSQVALKKSRGEDINNMKFAGEVELVSGLEQFQATISSPGAFAIDFEAASNVQCKQISSILHTLSNKYPSINFLKVDMEESPTVASAENVRVLPTFKIYKQGNFLKEAVSPNPEELESLISSIDHLPNPNPNLNSKLKPSRASDDDDGMRHLLFLASLAMWTMNTSQFYESLENRPLLTFSLKRVLLHPRIGDF